MDNIENADNMDNTDNTKRIENEHSEYLYNVMENEVVEEAKVMIPKDPDVCQCEKCFYDICAIVLNSIKPHYITTTKGELFARTGKANWSEKRHITVEVLRAIEVVKQRKSH